jgi:deoxyribodipyrimidine photo-lyase
MNKLYSKALFIFRRDLRLYDNTGLITALESAEQVIPCFIFDPKQVGEENEYRSTNSIQFMINSLKDLDAQLHQEGGRLYLFYGDAAQVLEKLVDDLNVDAVFVNRDYTPFSIKRDEHLQQVCNRHKSIFHSHGDSLLNEPETIITQNGTPYAVFTPFFKRCASIPVRKISTFPKPAWFTQKLDQEAHNDIYATILGTANAHLHVKGGRSEGLQLLENLTDLKNYQETRDFPALSTSNLSAHLKFGTLSIREVFYHIQEKLGQTHSLLRQLYWRDFFTYVAYHSPFVFGHAYQEIFDDLTWEHDQKKFKQWCEGETGFPIVDAGMRQLNTTGYMHNRVRIIVASFLTKDLRIDWRWGEKYFAQKLVDYDPALNNGNWQWASSTGCDAQPYFRIFNPWLQQKKFDPDCVYIKRWVPELKKLSPNTIHDWEKEKHWNKADYPRPMIDHKKEAARTLTWFKKHKQEKNL